MGHHQQAHDNQEKQAQGCIVDVIIANLVRVLFDPAIPTSSFNLFNYFYTCYYSFLLPSGQFMSFNTIPGVVAR